MIRSRAVLVAIGIDWEGRRQVLGVEMANRGECHQLEGLPARSEARVARRDFRVSDIILGLSGRFRSSPGSFLATLLRAFSARCARSSAAQNCRWLPGGITLSTIGAMPRKPAETSGSIRSFVFRAGLFFFIRLRFRQGAVAPSSPPEPRGYGGRVAPIP